MTVFKVKRVLKGDAGDFITVHHDVSPAACGETFDHHGRRLLLIYEGGGRYFVNAFSDNPFLQIDEKRKLAELLGITEQDVVDGFEAVFENDIDTEN